MKRILIVLNSLALIITIIINYLSNTGFFNGNTMKIISDRYHNFFTPASYAFSIWGLIYLSLATFVIYSSSRYLKNKNGRILRQISLWFIISCVANSFWVIVWLNDYIGLSVLIMIVILISLWVLVLNTSAPQAEMDLQEKLFVRFPFELYFGWITVALIANIAAWLTKTGWNGFGIAKPLWAVAMIGIAGLLNLALIWKRSMWIFGLVGCWALTAIAVENLGHAKQVVTAGIITAVILFGSSIIKAFQKHEIR